MSKERSKKPISKARKITNWVFTILFGLLFAVVAVFQIAGLCTKSSNFGIPNYFGNQMCLVLTDSMAPEIKPGETVFVKKVDPSKIKVDDDVMFYDANTGKVTTHRVTEITIPTESDNLYYFTTHGVNPNSNQGVGPDGQGVDCREQYQHFSEKYLMGKVVFVSATIGSVLTFMTSGFGLLILLIIPALYLIITSIIDLVKALDDKDDENSDSNGGGTSQIEGLSLEDKERLKKELLQELVDSSEKGD